MTDNRTTELLRELRKMLDLCRRTEAAGFETYWITVVALDNSLDELEQAIAATLGSDKPPYDELLRCLENDWNIRARWDGLRKFWCIELTEEGVWMRDAACGTLTAEQVRAAIFAHSPCAGRIDGKYFAEDIHIQAIADELNSELGSGTCELTMDGTDGCFGCSECFENIPPLSNFCPNCGRKVVKR